YRLVTEWLAALPALFPDYSKLPPGVTANHRAGIGQLLQKYGGPRTEKFTELGLVGPLYKGLSGSGDKYALIPEAFFFDLRNLRQDELCNLFGRVSLSELHSWLGNHSGLNAYCGISGGT